MTNTPKKEETNDREWKGKVTATLDNILLSIEEIKKNTIAQLLKVDLFRDRCDLRHHDIDTTLSEHGKDIENLTRQMAHLFKVCICVVTTVIATAAVHTILNK